jgi:hypothetical protein
VFPAPVNTTTKQWVPHTPDFLLSPVGSTSFLRLSLMKAAHAVIGGASNRKSGISLVFREMWETRPFTPSLPITATIAERQE